MHTMLRYNLIKLGRLNCENILSDMHMPFNIKVWFKYIAEHNQQNH